MAILRDAINKICDISTTSSCGNVPQDSAIAADARTRFLSAARMHGWTGLADASIDGLSFLGRLRGLCEGIMIAQDEIQYAQYFIAYALIDVRSRCNDTVLSPGVLNDLAQTFLTTGDISSRALVLDDDDIGFMLCAIRAIANLVSALISRVENEQNVCIAFSHFIYDPTSYIRFTQAYGPFPSIQQIVRDTHRGSQARHPSFRSLTVGLPQSGVIDVEAGAEIVMLHDEEIEYIAAFFVATLMRTHGTIASNVIGA
jgi:hypothetical protein